MIDKISSKQSDLDGQLDVIYTDNKLQFIPAYCFKYRRCLKENPQIILAFNQLYEISQIIDFARHNLILSSGDMTRAFTKKFMSTDDSDVTETISSFFLSSSISFYNSSFDYLWIILMLLFSSYDDLIEIYPEKEIKKEMKKMGLNEDEWFKALFKKFMVPKFKKKKYFSKICVRKRMDRKKWIKKNSNIPDKIKMKILDLNGKNKTLKKSYQANSLKHGKSPYFKRSNPLNAIGAELKLSKEQFYAKSGSQGISSGLPQNRLNIDDVQRFLIDYNNRTVEVVTLIIEEKLWIKVKSK